MTGEIFRNTTILKNWHFHTIWHPLKNSNLFHYKYTNPNSKVVKCRFYQFGHETFCKKVINGTENPVSSPIPIIIANYIFPILFFSIFTARQIHYISVWRCVRIKAMPVFSGSVHCNIEEIILYFFNLNFFCLVMILRHFIIYIIYYIIYKYILLFKL